MTMAAASYALAAWKTFVLLRSLGCMVACITFNIYIEKEMDEKLKL